MAILEVSGLFASYRGQEQPILKDISFAVGAGEFVAIIGPSGAGKSTLIRCINRLVEPSAGKIRFYEKEVTEMRPRDLRGLRRDIGMIFQEFNLVDRMSVMDNVLCGRLGHIGAIRSIFRFFPRADIVRALELLDRVGLIEQAGRRADQLSGGQRQRVGIARALMQNPRLLLLDEPTSSLDPKISREIMGLISEVAAEWKVPVLCNIHDVRLALEFCVKVIGLQNGEKKFDGPSSAMDAEKLEDIYAGEVL